MTIRNEISSRGTSRLDQNLSSFLQLTGANSGSPAKETAERSNEITRRLVQCLTHIIQTFDCRESPNYFPQAFSLLESLPLATADYDLAKHRLENALRYADSFESGAAIYELRIMLARFRNTS